MIVELIRNTGSMILSPARVQGRSWVTELIVRTIRGVLDAGNAKGVDWLREKMNRSAGYHPAFAKVSMNTRDIAGIPCMLLSPKNGASSNKVTIYFHGGGYIAGSPISYKPILAQLAVDTQGLVIAPDYRLAPEHPFPAPQDDCLEIAKTVIKTYDDKVITLAGDSAGGALAIATALELAKSKARQVDKLVLLSPWVDPTASGGTMTNNIKHDALVRSLIDNGIEGLMQGGDLHNARVNFANSDLSALPRTLVQYAGSEIFADQIETFCNRAKESGVDLEIQNYVGQFHVFQMFSAILSDAKLAMKEIALFINHGSLK